MEQDPRTQDLSLAAKLEAVLFYRAEPMRRAELCRLLSADEPALDAAVAALDATLAGRGLSLVRVADELALGTSSGAARLIEELTKDELSRDIGKAGLETLAIILYKGPISRREIDHIRGVNSSFILRNLLIRGLIARVEDPDDARTYRYQTTPALLAFLGTESVEKLPEFEAIQKEFAAFSAAKDAAQPEGSSTASAASAQ